MPSRGTQSDLWGASHGGGKGDKTRVSNVKAYQDNWPLGERAQGHFKKTYGNAPQYEKLPGRVVIH